MSTSTSVRTPASPAETAHWLPAGKTAAICFSVDDIHPATSHDSYEAGGDLEAGALGRLVRLQRRHRQLKATLCVTPDWRLDSLVADGRLLRHIPWLNRFVHHSRLQCPGRFRLDRHPEFVAFLNGLERCEVVPHGLHHAHVGPRRAVEFQDQGQEQCAAMVQRGLEIFAAAKLRFVRGYVPPAWNAPRALIAALGRLDFRFITSARDLHTPVSPSAVTAMSGLKGLSLIHPQTVGDRQLVHLPCNFQATSAIERAVGILEAGGMLHIKAHIFKTDGRHVMADGLDELYCNYLDLLFSVMERRFGGQLWWAHLSEVAERFRARP
ncbi:MAG TPA: DUF2334 domain-containing protein [Steroidobacteraceae bacterium]|jgi:hypothetical protein|nr:DUF2334 domain-containing protein [Steroidobacteraceae bacterium]